MHEPRPPDRVEEDFEAVFHRELLKSERKRAKLLLVLAAVSCVVGLTVMVLGRAHFESIGDHQGSRFLLLTAPVAVLVYARICARVLDRRIEQRRRGTGRLGTLNALVEPTAISVWLLLEGLLFAPGAMFESPIPYAYAVVILLSSLQLRWRLCLLTSAVAAAQYMALVAWHWISVSGNLPATASSYLPLHGMRAFLFLMAGAAAAFVAREIRGGIEQALHRMSERNRVVGIFGRYLTDDVVDAILGSPDGLRLGGESRTITILMTDLRGFSSLSERLPPESVIAMLNNCLASMTEVIVRHRGTIDEFIGDAILVFFGAPFLAEDDAERAVACALQMQLAMGPVNEWNRRHGFPPLEMGIGVHTGTVVVGNIGSEKRSKYGAVGSAVNLTSRIESYTVGGQVLVSAATAEALGPRLRVEGRRTVQPKGAAGPIEICDVTGISGRYQVQLQAAADALVPLRPALPVGFVVFEGKDAAGRSHEGELTELSEKRARLSTSVELEPLANLRLELREADGRPVPGHLMAKIVEGAGSAFLLRFTSVEQGAQQLIARRLGRAGESGRGQGAS